MSLFKKTWFRWFAGAFCFGATAVPIGVTAFDFKNPEVKMGRFSFNGNAAWALMAVNFGIVAGTLGLGVAALKESRSKSA